MSKIDFLQSRIVTLEEAKRKIGIWRMKDETIVFTNGCFDILHKGHVTYLAKAADLGNRLIVGVNSDASVKRQGKGEERPINAEEARQTILASLTFVDLVIIFDGDTPEDLIHALNPDILVKGADYDPNETDKNSKKFIVGSDYVRTHGGQVAVIDLVEGFSTTGIVKKLKDNDEL
jgi:rfaE bifunctional protein nucleotidyltransferase chain/domain